MAQFIDEQLPAREASRLLEAEYKVLCQCDGFKSWFDTFARDSGVTVPGLSNIPLACHLLSNNQLSMSISRTRSWVTWS